MSTLDEQIVFEEEMVRLGIERYRKIMSQAIRKGEETNLNPTNKLMMQAITPMVGAIDALKDSLKKPGRKHRALVFIKDMDSDEVALITAKAIMTGISTKRSYHSISLTIGSILEEQVIFHKFKAANEKYWKRVVKKVSTSTRGDDGRRAAVRGYAKQAKVWEDLLTSTDKISIGAYLIKEFEEQTGLITISNQRQGSSMVSVSDQCAAWLSKAHLQSELLSPVWLPMLIEPNDWEGMRDGGYFTKRLPLVKTGNRGYLNDPLNVPSETVLNAINAVQRTAWTINDGVLGVMMDLVDAESTLGGLPPADKIQPPCLPCAEDEVAMFKESFKDDWTTWKRKRLEVHQANARAVSHRISLGQAMETAKKMVQYDRFYFPWTMDWRGRMYPVASSLNPQGNSVAKGLLKFADGKPLDAEGMKWFKISMANSYGIDKVSFEERIKWVDEHSTTISMCAIDPFSYKFWADADSPWEFLAYALEYEELQRDPNALSYLPVRGDGSCNGLQHLSAVLLDPVGAAAVNLLPSDQPSDIYAQVASLVSSKVTNDAQHGIEEAKVWYGKVDRSIVKRNVMTLAYGSTKRGRLDQLLEDIGKAQDGKTRQWLQLPDDENLFPYFKYLNEQITDAMGEIVKAAPTVMSWIQEVASVAAEEQLPVRWVTPAGFNVLHSYCKTEDKRVETSLGTFRIQIMVKKETKKLDVPKIRLAVSPNWVHSLDASHCHSTVAECIKLGVTHFAMVHDSYGCHAADMPVMAKTLRSEFIKMYSGNLMLDLLGQISQQVGSDIAAKLPEPPKQGDFELQLIENSGYFFA